MLHQQPSTSPARRPSSSLASGSVTSNDRRRRSRRRSSRAGFPLRLLLRNIQALDKDFAHSVSECFQRYILAEGLDHLGFEQTIACLRELGLEGYIDGHVADTSEGGGAWLSEGDDSRRQIRLWSARLEDLGVSDEQCFLWIAWRGRRFIDLSELLWPHFSALDTACRGTVGRLEIIQGLSDDACELADMISSQPTDHKEIEELRSAVTELFDYHAGWQGEIDFASFVSLTCDLQERFALARLGCLGPVSCELRVDRGVTFLRPLSPLVFVPRSTATQQLKQSEGEAR